MKLKELYAMTDEQLKELSLDKVRTGRTKGNATQDALKAQRVLWERGGNCFDTYERYVIPNNNDY